MMSYNNHLFSFLSGLGLVLYFAGSVEVAGGGVDTGAGAGLFFASSCSFFYLKRLKA